MKSKLLLLLFGAYIFSCAPIGNYTILKNTTAPAVLLELGYLSNPAELDVLKKDETKKDYARILSGAIVEYFEAG